MSQRRSYEELNESLNRSEAERVFALRIAEEVRDQLDAIGRYLNRCHSFSANRDDARSELVQAAKAITDELTSLRETLKKQREAINDAPHGPGCGINNGHNLHTCNCWKMAALAPKAGT